MDGYASCTPRRFVGVLAAVALTLSCNDADSRSPGQQGDQTVQSLPRTPDDKPDLQGVWTHSTITPLERRPEFGDRLVLTDAEVTALEQAAADRFEFGSVSSTGPGAGNRPDGREAAYDNFWTDSGSKVIYINGERRSSIIVDPPNGQIPPLTGPAQKARAELEERMRLGGFDGPELRPLGERCILSFGSSVPLLPATYNNYLQIVQTPDHVVILTEMVHDARIVRIGGFHPPPAVTKWLGDSVGRWEGDTLVVETTNFSEKESVVRSPASRRLTVVERFTRVGPDTIVYQFTIDDPLTYTTSWRGELPLRSVQEHIYEYACHEGNYALAGILAGARAQEKEMATPRHTRKR